MDADGVMRWVGRYERAWRDGDVDAVGGLFSDEAAYRPSPYEEAEVGHDAIRAFWLADEGRVFTMVAEPVAVDGSNAVVRVEVRYGDPVTQEYRDLWLLRFADDGRVEDFEEWADWPGRPYTADGATIDQDELLALEHAGWSALCDGTAAAFYAATMADDGLMILANGDVMDRDAVVEALGAAPPWASYSIDHVRWATVAGGAVALVYRGTARRHGDEDAPFVAAMTSVYTRRAGRWQLALYQQTPTA